MFVPFFYKNTPHYKNIRYVSTPSKKHIISLQALLILTSSIRASILILSTSYGLMTHTEALRLKTGGIIMCVLN